MKKIKKIKRCYICGKTKKETALVNATVDGKRNDYCTECIQIQNDKRITSLGYETNLGFGTGAPTTDTSFYFKVNPEYFANADKVSATYSHEKPMDNKAFETYTRLRLTAQVLGIHIDGFNIDPVIDLLDNKDNRAWKIYDSIVPVSKEEYEAL